MLQVRLNGWVLVRTFYFKLFNCYLILHCRTKRKQALLRSNLPGIHPVADEVIRRFQVWFIQTLFCAITFEAHMP
jgi:hypothetical protein